MKLPELVSTYFLASHSFLKLQKTGFSIYSECALEKVRRCGYFKDQVRWIPVASGIVGYWALEPDSLCLIPAPLLTSYMDVGHLLNHPGLHSPYVWNGGNSSTTLLLMKNTATALVSFYFCDPSPSPLKWLFSKIPSLVQCSFSPLEWSNTESLFYWMFQCKSHWLLIIPKSPSPGIFLSFRLKSSPPLPLCIYLSHLLYSDYN